VVALVSLPAAQSLMVAANASIDSPPTLILVHIVAIGWRSLLILPDFTSPKVAKHQL
jgi:hypothetical protein